MSAFIFAFWAFCHTASAWDFSPPEPYDMVVHCAAKVSSVLSLSELHKDNVFVTQKVIATGKPLVFVSTLSVLKPGRTKETDMPASADIYTVKDGYASSKNLAESLCRKAFEEKTIPFLSIVR